jgi:hypothetical protein
MASSMVRQIKDTSDRVWPEVSRALKQTTLSIVEVAGLAESAVAQVESYTANHERGHWKRRQICNETVWAMAQIGRLRSGEEAAVIQAATELVAILKEVKLDELEPEEKQLIKAVQSLPGWEA